MPDRLCSLCSRLFIQQADQFLLRGNVAPNLPIRWVVSASSSVMMAHAAFDVAVANYPDQRFMLRNRALVIRKHGP